MANSKQIDVTVASTTDPEVKSLVASRETRFKEGSKTQEEYRWVAKLTILEKLCNVRSIAPLTSTEINLDMVSGTFQGGATLDLYASGMSTVGRWSLIEEALVAVDQSGSLFVERTQLWVGVSPWSDVNWNAP